MVEQLPFRLHRAASIISRTDDPDKDDAQSACAETAARIVILEEALRAVVEGKPDAAERARWALGFKWS